MKIKQECIVTITDGLSPTSMPFNEFVKFRCKNYPKEKQILIQVFEKGVDSNIEMPEDIEYYSVGMNVVKLAKVIKEIEKNYHIKVFHIHEGKSVIIFSVASLLTRRKKTVYTIHSTFKNYPLHNKVFSFIASLLSSKVSCVSKTSYKYYPSILKRLLGRNVTPIQNGVDLDRIDLIRDCNTHENDIFTITYVARLVALKRHDFLLNVISRLHNVKLELIGIGPLENTLKEKCKELGIENRVNFKGLISREEVYRLLRKTNLYISTSSYEGLPIGVMEAMGCKAICMVSDIEQHNEIAEVCPSLITLPMDLDTWVKYIKSIQKLSKEESLEIGEKNYSGVKDNFSLQSMHNNYNRLYDKLDT